VITRKTKEVDTREASRKPPSSSGIKETRQKQKEAETHEYKESKFKAVPLKCDVMRRNCAKYSHLHSR
jgi:hypothetical protein